VRPRKAAKRSDIEEADDDVGDTYDFLTNRSKRYSSMLSSSHQGMHFEDLDSRHISDLLNQGVSLWSTNLAEGGGDERQVQASDEEDVANLLLE